MPGLMSRWGLDRAPRWLRGYGKIRDDWMAADLDGWLAPNRIYPGVAEACIAAEESDTCDLYVVTTKQARFASAIMERKATSEIPDERLFSQTVSGVPKTDVLAAGAAAAPARERKSSWRINSARSRKCARATGWRSVGAVSGGLGLQHRGGARARAQNPRIQVIAVEDFVGMLRGAAEGK